MRGFSLSLIAALPISGAALAQEGLAYDLELAGHQALSAVQQTHEPATFKTDGCSGGMSAAWRVAARLFPSFEDTHGDLPPWEGCCVTHDHAYHAGGQGRSSQQGYQDRQDADLELQNCVIEGAKGSLDTLADAYGLEPDDVIIGYDLIGAAMYRAVRLGGAPCSGLPWRWGYGYPQCIVMPADIKTRDVTIKNQ